MTENELDEKTKYCLVKYFHYEATKKHLKCAKCVMECKHKKELGDSHDKSTD